MEVVNNGTNPHGGKYVQLRGKGLRQTLELNWYPPGSRFSSEYTPGEETDHLAFVVKDPGRRTRSSSRRDDFRCVPGRVQGTEVYVKDPDGIR